MGWAVMRGGFWNERRRRVYPRLLVVVALFWSVAGFSYLWVGAERDGERYGGDFLVYWSAARLAEQGRPADVYDIQALWAEERQLDADSEPFPWHYPPQFLLLVRPLAALPYGAALAAWTLLRLAALGGAMWAAGARGWATAALTLPAVGVNAAFGQNALFTGAILGGGLARLESRPMASGLVLGLLTYKPHFALLVFLVLLGTRRWAALGGALISATCLAALSLAWYGPDTWRAFVDDLDVAAAVLYEPGAWEKMPSFTAALLLLDSPDRVAQGLQLAWSLCVALAVLLLWRPGPAVPARNAALVVGTFAASPYVFVYDLAALGPAYGWYLCLSRGDRTRRFEGAVLAGCSVLPVAAWALAALTRVQVGPFALACLLALIVASQGRTTRRGRCELPHIRENPEKFGGKPVTKQ